MNPESLRRGATAVLSAALGLLGACTSIYSVKIPLTTDEQPREDASHVVIEDHRPPEDRETRTGKLFGPCARLYGDDTYLPSKLAYLDRLIAERIPASRPIHIHLDRFDTIEYCENTAAKAGAAAAYGATSASGNPVYMVADTRAGGDSMHLRIAGEINGHRFDVSRMFDYEHLPVRFTQMPSANLTYRETLHRLLDELADDIVATLPPE